MIQLVVSKKEIERDAIYEKKSFCLMLKRLNKIGRLNIKFMKGEKKTKNTRRLTYFDSFFCYELSVEEDTLGQIEFSFSFVVFK